jgi:hypothetical protein
MMQLWFLCFIRDRGYPAMKFVFVLGFEAMVCMSLLLSSLMEVSQS